MLLDFGQPVSGIIQTAFVVQDIRQSISTWLKTQNVGPWFLQERWAGKEAMYRGQPSKAEIAAAIAYSGHTQIELIQPLDDYPSVYQEVIQDTGYGFHHVARGSVNYEADVQAYTGRGFELAFQVRVPTGSWVGYMDTRNVLAGFTELIQNTEANEQFFTDIYRAAIRWDGTDPLRYFG